MKKLLPLFLSVLTIGCSHKSINERESAEVIQVFIEKSLSLEGGSFDYAVNPCFRLFSIGSVVKKYSSGKMKKEHFCLDKFAYFQNPLGFLKLKKSGKIEFCSDLEPYYQEHSKDSWEHGWGLNNCQEVEIET